MDPGIRLSMRNRRRTFCNRLLLLLLFSKSLLQELNDMLAAVEAMPWLWDRITEDAAGQRSVIFARVDDHLHRDSRLAQGAALKSRANSVP